MGMLQFSHSPATAFQQFFQRVIPWTTLRRKGMGQKAGLYFPRWEVQVSNLLKNSQTPSQVQKNGGSQLQSPCWPHLNFSHCAYSASQPHRLIYFLHLWFYCAIIKEERLGAFKESVKKGLNRVGWKVGGKWRAGTEVATQIHIFASTTFV